MEWCEKLNTTEGKQNMFKIAKQLKRDKKDIVGSSYIKDEDSSIKVVGVEAAERWKGILVYF